VKEVLYRSENMLSWKAHKVSHGKSQGYLMESHKVSHGKPQIWFHFSK